MYLDTVGIVRHVSGYISYRGNAVSFQPYDLVLTKFSRNTLALANRSRVTSENSNTYRNQSRKQ